MTAPHRILPILAPLLLAAASLSLARDTLSVNKLGEWGNFYNQTSYEAYDDGVLYVRTSSGIGTIDASDPADLRPLGHYDVHGMQNYRFPNISIHGDVGFIYGADYWQNPATTPIIVLDLSDPARPVKVSEIACADPPRAIVGYENYLYIGDRQPGLRVIDIADPEHPEDLGRLWEQDHGMFTTLFIYRAKGFFNGGIYDLTNPLEPERLFFAGVFPKDAIFGDSIAVKQGYADHHNTMHIVRFDNPDTVRTITVLDDGDYYDYIAFGQYLIKTGQGEREGLFAYDMSDPANPVMVDSIRDDSHSWLAQGSEAEFFRYGYFGMESWTFDVEHGFQFLDNFTDNGGVNAVAKFGNRAVVDCGIGGVFGIDVSDPRNPREVMQYEGFPERVSFHSRENILYIIGVGDQFESNLTIYDFSDPDAPELLSTTRLPDEDYLSASNYDDETLYGVTGDSLYSIDLSNLRNPQFRFNLPLAEVIPYQAIGLSVGEERLYLSLNSYDYRDSLRVPLLAILKKDDPANDPVIIWKQPFEYMQDAALEGDKLFLLTSESRGDWGLWPKLTGYDISNPDEPIEVFSNSDIDSTSYAIRIDNGHLYVAFGYEAGHCGFDIWDAGDVHHLNYLGYLPFYVSNVEEDGLAYMGRGSSFQIWQFGDWLSSASERTDLTPNTLSLSAFPNPFNSIVTVRYSLPVPSLAKITVEDIAGRRVAMLSDGHPPFNSPPASKGGKYAVVWNATGASAGTYFVRLEAAGVTRTEKVILVK